MHVAKQPVNLYAGVVSTVMVLCSVLLQFHQQLLQVRWGSEKGNELVSVCWLRGKVSWMRELRTTVVLYSLVGFVAQPAEGVNNCVRFIEVHTQN